MTLTDTVKQAIDRRAELLAAVAEIDRDLQELREVLSGGTTSTMAAAPESRVVVSAPAAESPVATPAKAFIVQPETLAARDAAILRRLEAGAASKNELIRELPDEPGKDKKQRENDCANALTRLRREGRIEPGLAGWSLCGQTPPQEPRAVEPTEIRGHDVALAPLQPERRCGRCCHKFRPSQPRQYVCDNCADKPTRVAPSKPEPELEPVWSGRDSLIPDRESRGSQLSGGEFSSGGRRT